MRDKEDIIRYLAQKKDMPAKRIAQIVDSQFAFVAEKISSGEFEKPILLRYFGTFSVHPYRLKKIREWSKKKKEAHAKQSNRANNDRE